MNTFFIAGLPRSRTAWCASYLSYGSTAAFHDMFLTLRSLRDIQLAFERTGASLVGNCDAANAPMWRVLDFAFPDARWIVIERDPKEVQSSLNQIHGAVTFNYNEWRPSIDAIIRYKRAEVIPFAKLSTATLKESLPGFSSPEWRDQLFDKMNIQIHKPILERDIAALRQEESWAQ